MRCAVFGCNSDNQTKNFDGTTRFFSFPKDSILKRLWVNACCRLTDFNPETSRICSKHFKVEDYLRNLKYELLKYLPKKGLSLKPDAVPSLNLPKSKMPTSSQQNHQGRVVKRTLKKCALELLPRSVDFSLAQKKEPVKIENAKFSNDIDKIQEKVVFERKIKEEVDITDLKQEITRPDDFLTSQKEESVKIESTESLNKIEKMHEWQIKEEIDIKEFLEQNTIRSEDFPLAQKEDLVKIENDILQKEEIIQDMAIHEWEIKEEEVDIKEGLGQDTVSVSPNGFDQVKPKYYSAHECCECDSQISSKTARSSNIKYDYSSSLKEFLIPEDINILRCDQCTLEKHLFRPADPEELNTFKCDECNFKTLYKTSLKEHLLRHKDPEEVNTFKCGQCDYKTCHKKSLQRHLLRHEDPEGINKLKCDQCNFKTREKYKLKLHLLRHEDPEGINKLKCDECNYKTHYQIYLKRHLLRHKGSEKVNEFKCDQCKYTTVYKKSLDIHLLRHKDPEEVNKFKCDLCNYNTFYKSNLKERLLRHKDPEEACKYKCSQCNYKTFTRNKLEAHLLRHNDPEEVNKFKCDQCNFKTFYKSNLKEHLRHKNPDEVKNLKCVQCNYKTFDKRRLERHLLLHKDPEEVNEFECDHCTYKTLYKKNLNIHLRRHKDPEEQKQK